MIIDDALEFCDAVSVAGSTGTALVGDVVDLGAITRDVGHGETTYFVATVDTEIITGGSAGTIQFSLVSDSTDSIATNGTATVHWTSASLATGAAASNAKLAKGAVLAQVALPDEPPVYERYLGILVTIGSQAVTAGKINAFITKDPRKLRAYPGNTGFDF